MSEALFLRLLFLENKEKSLADAIAMLHHGTTFNPEIFGVDPNSFEQIPGSPFAYWVSDRIRRLFTILPSFEGDGRTVKSGLNTGEDFRFLRVWWEVRSEKILNTQNGDDWRINPIVFANRCRDQIQSGKYWVPFAKGGSYSPYYADLHLVLNWQSNGEDIRRSSRAYIRSESLYFKPGVTYSARTTSGISFRLLNAGAIFSHKGPAAFMTDVESTLGLLQSSAFEKLLQLQLGAADAAARSYEVGLIQQTPLPVPTGGQQKLLAKLVRYCVDLKRGLDTANEISHVFEIPAVLQVKGDGLTQRADLWRRRMDETKEQLAENQREIDDIAYRLFRIESEDRTTIETTFTNNLLPASTEEIEAKRAYEADAEQPTGEHQKLTGDMLSYFIGCTFGRWDVRHATGERPTCELPDPFAPLPACAPSALTDSDGLPCRKSPSAYPLRAYWDGMLVDDPDHDDDIIRRVREVFELLWQERAEEMEREAARLMSVKDLRDYFRKPTAGGFWTDHVQRYSKSRRKAPIYWVLRSSKGNYSIWLYYHRLDKDILHKALLTYVEPKLRLEQNNLEQLRQQREIVGTTGREAKLLERQLDKQESFLSELHDFHDKLKCAADLHLEPDLDDGVILNIAPLWELVPWKEAEKYWKELREGRYEWSSIGKQLRNRGLVRQ